MTMHRIIAAAFGALLLAGPAVAQGTNAMTESQLRFLDKNADGSVSQQEYTNYLGNAFDYLDTDGNGSLSQAETGELLGPGQFQAMDTNSNGQISRQEFLAQGAKDFATADRDRSGQLQ